MLMPALAREGMPEADATKGILQTYPVLGKQ